MIAPIVRRVNFLMLLVILFVATLVAARHRTPGTGESPTLVVVKNVETQNRFVSILNAQTLGSPTAAIGIVDFSDFACRICRDFANGAFERIKREFVETSHITYTVKHLPPESDARTWWAARAAECAGLQGHYWDMHRRLLSPSISRSMVSTVAATMQLDADNLSKCVDDTKSTITFRIAADREEALRLGILGTPTFLVGERVGGDRIKILRRIRGSPAYEVFRDTLREILDKR